MHQALRNNIGETHVERKSLVSPNHLRFDFSSFCKVTDEETRQVEDFVNGRIQEQLPLIERRDSLSRVVEGYGFVCEKYGDHVRKRLNLAKAWSFVEEFT
jgi:alanyl-tRNA synthetase